ncbi:cytochrome P450 [Ralstonia solanacearum]|uniref:Rhih cytochrome p450 monooxygenase, rhizoxin biosynthesis n=1 Tax=Ralstonia solanacearum (strain Po82) TaxID=1031711 RepID=F6GAG1_RALS8|nr:cytochrome P450 [Ralstonia solanacearum]AEG71676.1 rhih cytochrome p450 monooxygenase, rhizoxin biosynthesis [Ralstonia solanacearum Po82]AMP71591.1 cytochrome [Ralstonia solanacearum]AMP76484.1 cytochrome [Ralstonia solanacearum]AYB63004.1 cytochrome P450 [Ralstonia solanacearum]MBB6588699.1 cytochrome P450 [Ralstonia solanacearum]
MKLADLSTPSFLENPYPLYETLRAQGPFVRIGPNALMTGRYSIVDALLHNRQMGKNYMDSIRLRYGEEGPKMPLFQGFSRMFLLINPPAHTRLRSMMMQAFNARQIESMRELATVTAHQLIDAFEQKRSADLVAEFAFPLPVRIICQMLDIDVDDAMVLGAAASKLAKVFDPAPMSAGELVETSAAYEELAQYFTKVIEARRAQSGTDLISMLLRVEEDGHKLTHDEIVSNVILLFMAGHETTSNMIGNALIALHRNPQQLDLLRRDPSRMPNAVLECLRYDGSVQVTIRAAMEDVEVEGEVVPRGTTVFLMLGAANRDPDQFTEPDRLDIGRQDGRLQTFGAGIHHCLGYRLALIELETALSALFTRLPDLRLTNLDQLGWNQRGNLRGVNALMAAW